MLPWCSRVPEIIFRPQLGNFPNEVGKPVSGKFMFLTIQEKTQLVEKVADGFRTYSGKIDKLYVSD